MEKNLYIRTKRDRSGNWYYLIVDLEEKTMTTDYNIGKTKDDCIEVSSKKALLHAEVLLKKSGFRYVIKIR